MNKTFIEGALYCGLPSEPDYILKLVRGENCTDLRFEAITPAPFSPGIGGLIGFGYITPDEFRRAFHWSDLPTAKDREEAALKVDPLNGKFEDEILRHYAAKRARLRQLTPVLGGEYYAKP